MTKQNNAKGLDRKVLRIGSILLAILIALIGIFYWIVQDSWRAQYLRSATVSPQTWLIPGGEGSYVITQRLTSPMDNVESITLWTSRMGQEGKGLVTLSIFQENQLLYAADLDIESMPDQDDFTVALPQDLMAGMRDKPLTLTLTVPLVDGGTPVAFGYGTSVNVGKFDVLSSDDMNALTVNDSPVYGALYCKLYGYNNWDVMNWFFPVAALIVLCAAAIVVVLAHKKACGKYSALLYGAQCCKQYSFLIRQLVQRDFNIKYKRSVLGVLWSFLNPVLTMSIQYLVFSTIFRSAIENFPLYLLSGIICFNYFSEAVSIGMESITGNASLITKVYMPKYIYPISKVLSSLINLLISLVPLVIVMILSGVNFTKALLLLPIPLCLLVLFCLGMSFLLSTANVFFRDTRFLWGVLSMIWMYITPLFYPETIIPLAYRTLYHCNPMYQFISFFRNLVCDGITPAPNTYLWCLLCAFIPLALGVWIFHKKQDSFIIYL